jgi:hypothetical protein
MRKQIALTLITILSVLLLASCETSKSEFTSNALNDTQVTFSAETADEEASLTAGPLVLEEAGSIAASADLTEGSIRVEIFKAAEGEDAETEGEAIMTGDLINGESATGTFEPGRYVVKATILKKATGSVTVKIE